MDGSIKKNSAFVKKCKNINYENIEGLLKELSGLKVVKYLDEIVGSLCENKFSKSSDSLAAARLCVELHLRYEDFGQSILKAIWGKVTYIIVDNLMANINFDPCADAKEETGRISKVKTWVRFLTELFLLGFENDLRSDMIIKVLEAMVIV